MGPEPISSTSEPYTAVPGIFVHLQVAKLSITKEVGVHEVGGDGRVQIGCCGR